MSLVTPRPRGEVRTGGTPPARAYLLEGGTIVIGILLALILGAGWEWLNERWSEAEYLEGLEAEFERGVLELQVDMEAREAILYRTRTLLTLPDGPAAGLPTDSAGAYAASLIDFRYFTPTHPVLEELIAGGRLEVLRSETLRRALLKYILERDRLEVVEARERDFAADLMEPFLVERLALEPRWAADDSSFAGPLVDAAELARLARDPAFRSLLVLRADRTDIALRFSRGLGFSIDSVLGALRRQDR